MTETLLTPNDKKRLEEYESKTDVELALLSVYQGDGIDSKNRAALAKYVLDRRNAGIRDGREERTLKIAEEAKNATIKQALLGAMVCRYSHSSINSRGISLRD